MSDAEGKGLSEQQTRKSSRQKTPNTYYKQDISDIRGEPKPKPTKQPIQKASKSKKKSDKTSSKQVFNSSSNPLLLQQQAQGKQAFSKESSKSVDRDDDSENVNIDKDDEPMEVESDPASDAPEGSEHQDSPSLSQEESKKSYQNNANTSYTENEDNSNRPAGGYQTRKIRKKPKFADDNYFDNVPVAKTQQPKKQKTNKAQPTAENAKKPKQIKKEGASATGGESQKQTISSQQSENGNAPTISQEKPTAGAAQLSQTAQNIAKNSQKPNMKQTGVKKGEKQEKQNEEKSKDTTNDKALKEKKDTQKKDKTDDILKVGLLDIILDAIHQGNEPQAEAKQNQNANNSSSNNNNNSSNTNNQNQNQNNNSKQFNNNNQINEMSASNFLNLFNNALNGAQSTNQSSNNQQNTSKGNKRNSEVDKQKLNQMEDQTTQKKKQKTSKKEKKDQGNSEGNSQAASMENIQIDQKNSKKGEIRSVSTSIENGIPKNNENILRESNGNNQQSVSINGTIYNYPNINSKSDYITHVDKTKEKFILHHSSFEPMVINRIFLKDDVQKKIDMQQLLSQITLQQIQKQQQQQSQQAIQKLYQVAKEQDTQQQQSNPQQNIQYALSMISNILQKGQNFNQQQNNNSQQQAQQLQNMVNQLNNNPMVSNDKNSAIQQLLQRTLNQNGFANNNINNQNGFNIFANSTNFNEMFMRGLDQFNQFNQTANQMKNMNGNKIPNSNLMANKSRSQSQEFEPSLAQRKLSEHFKINTKNNDDEVQSNHSVAATSKPPSRKPSIQNPSIIQGIKANRDDNLQVKKEIKEEATSIQQNQGNSLFDDKIEKALNQLEMEIENQRKNSISKQEEKIKEEASKQIEKKQPIKMEMESNQENTQNQTAVLEKSKEQKQKFEKSIAETVEEDDNENEIEIEQNLDEDEDSDENDQEEQNKNNQQQQQKQPNNIDEANKNNANDFNTSLQSQLLGQQLLEMLLNNIKPQIPEINVKSEIKQELVNHVQPQSQEASSQNN
ncbi:hypothetical protein TTHERM_00227070 (macronuclear) [Tetrahymena thermophila SB210]|uniref:Uncharacterized protein n=1 Tax=Tetrahymena thermophila (strain SB210) TaxID=312017 RepID=Q23BX5_TETTS|nr:hypothetical protein TTHERM_00227070 [Tetrahymena thermophila SB210]EAR93993.4 hypothetical protein TTHERM_00227070 [Tetrahymena thermophila SB210]|eukprot:XP_001014238.4 hypothetical protein TTHERM_00227070 [Tetrahymena thermophila SB210]